MNCALYNCQKSLRKWTSSRADWPAYSTWLYNSTLKGFNNKDVLDTFLYYTTYDALACMQINVEKISKHFQTQLYPVNLELCVSKLLKMKNETKDTLYHVIMFIAYSQCHKVNIQTFYVLCGKSQILNADFPLMIQKGHQFCGVTRSTLHFT